MNAVEFKDVKKAYGSNVVIENISFEAEKGERLVLLGPSGCGKSTLLRVIAGLEDIVTGDVVLSGRSVVDVASGHRDVSMVFQNYALYPHMNVEKNITYGLKIAKVPKKEIEERLEMVLKMLELEPYRKRLPRELSGGQRQRVALARATVKNSPIFLLDEPLSNLDAQLRVAARQALLDIHEKFKQTMIYVTHDQIEALTFGTRIMLLNKGEIQMYDTPYNVYHFPKNVFTARFIGFPPMNIVENVRICKNHLNYQNLHMLLDDGWHDYLKENGEYICGIRPENILIHKEAFGGKTLEANVTYIENQGANYAVYLSMNGVKLVVIVKYVNFSIGETVHLELLQEHLHFFDKDTKENLGRPKKIKEINDSKLYDYYKI